MDETKMSVPIFDIGDIAVTDAGLQFHVKEINPHLANGQFLTLEPLPGQRLEKDRYGWRPVYNFRNLGPGEKPKRAPGRGVVDMEPPYQEY